MTLNADYLRYLASERLIDLLLNRSPKDKRSIDGTLRPDRDQR
jgi:hypothetical protein